MTPLEEAKHAKPDDDGKTTFYDRMGRETGHASRATSTADQSQGKISLRATQVDRKLMKLDGKSAVAAIRRKRAKCVAVPTEHHRSRAISPTISAPSSTSLTRLRANPTLSLLQSPNQRDASALMEW